MTVVCTACGALVAAELFGEHSHRVHVAVRAPVATQQRT